MNVLSRVCMSFLSTRILCVVQSSLRIALRCLIACSNDLERREGVVVTDSWCSGISVFTADYGSATCEISAGVHDDVVARRDNDRRDPIVPRRTYSGYDRSKAYWGGVVGCEAENVIARSSCEIGIPVEANAVGWSKESWVVIISIILSTYKES